MTDVQRFSAQTMADHFFPRLFPRSNPKWRQRRNSSRVFLNQPSMERRIPLSLPLIVSAFHAILMTL